MKKIIILIGFIYLLTTSALAQVSEKQRKKAIREYAAELAYDSADVDDWLSGKNQFAQYSSKYGWLLNTSDIRDGVDGSVCNYNYADGGLGERKMINHADKECRINTYGNSFVQCHQVSDGETWQEVLASHIGEPLRNYGVGGWSVYQAYLRMLEKEKENPAEFIIFNIYSDDHYRNLDAWRSIRVKRQPGAFGEVTLPYVEVNIEKDKIIEHPNPCPKPEDVYNLCDVEWVVNRFKDDFVFNLMLSHRINANTTTDNQYDELKKLSTTFGINTRIDNAESFNELSDEIHLRASFFASEKIVERIEEFAKKNNKKVLYVLSYNSYEIGKMIKEGKRFDIKFVEFLKEKGLNYVDLMAEHVKDYKKYKCDEVEYLSQYFIGHYNPRGNFFHAWSIKEGLVEMLDPKPTNYR
ncbi:MAG: hypothetical protein ABFS32_07960 [Bacteroidota bacterium]